LKINVRELPGPRSSKILDRNKKYNLGWAKPYPFIQSNEGEGCYFKDIDGNTFLDFSSQIASNPLGYNHPDLLKTLEKYSRATPVKFAGQDFIPIEHQDLIDELTTITPEGIDSAFLINSGAEAVENAMKIAFFNKPTAKHGISFEQAFHGRTLGALSATNSKAVQSTHFPALSFKRLPFDETAPEKLERIIHSENSPDDIGFVIMEPIQGEGGYRPAPERMMKQIRRITTENGIYLILDEVQSGMGRTGKWWAYEHYGIKPDIMTSGKALQVAATMANHGLQTAPGSISSTWGGGGIIDLATGIQIIKSIKTEKLLDNVCKMGKCLSKRLLELSKENSEVTNIRGYGLMTAFDLPGKELRDEFILESLRNGLVILGCGINGVRLIPPYIIEEEQIDQGLEIIEKTLERCRGGYKSEGRIKEFLGCGENVT
jgi:4-aminobutyrate aminotransferase